MLQLKETVLQLEIIDLAVPFLWISPQNLGMPGFTASSAPNGNSRFNPYTLYIKCILY